jgi:hypothetical protein
MMVAWFGRLGRRDGTSGDSDGTSGGCGRPSGGGIDGAVEEGSGTQVGNDGDTFPWEG